jgi:uncharacterized protein (TIGR00645 family)
MVKYREKSKNQAAVENLIEHIIFSSRWLLAPLYLGLVLALLVLVVKFIQGFIEISHHIFDSSLQQTTIAILETLDIALLGNLILIVMFSGYENFVSKIGVAERSEDRPSWMGRVDFSGLKIKLIGSLVAISVIQLLAVFLDPDTMQPEKLIWQIAIHLTFVVSGVLFAVMDYIADKRATIDLAAERQEFELKMMEARSEFDPTKAPDVDLDPTGE